MDICIDYSDKGIWIAWDAERGRYNFPRLEVCSNPVRLMTIMASDYPQAKIFPSDAAKMIVEYKLDGYIGSSLYHHDLERK
jgi:hypothetical protein